MEMLYEAIPTSTSIPEECLELLKSLDDATLEKCVRAMRNGTPGEPTSTEKGVLRKIANPLGIEDIIALSWAKPYSEQY
jgi:hypothetical protein